MTVPSDTLRHALAAVGWSPSSLARELACSPRLVGRWLAGAPGYVPPPAVVDWLADLAARHAERPAPTGWRARPLRGDRAGD